MTNRQMCSKLDYEIAKSKNQETLRSTLEVVRSMLQLGTIG